MPHAMYVKFAVFVVVGGLILWRFHRTRPAASVAPRRNLSDFIRDDDAGAGALDFVLTFTFFFPVIMMTVQMLLVFNAYPFVKYAAYYAARSAIVTIPETYTDDRDGNDEPRNVLGPAKRQSIREAAAWSVFPVSPTTANVVSVRSFKRNSREDAEFLGVDIDDVAGGELTEMLSFDLKWLAYLTRNYPGIFILNQLPLKLGGPANPDEPSLGGLPGGLGGFMGIPLTEYARYDTWEHKVGNALIQSSVAFYDADGNEITGDSYTFGPTDPVTVEVTYRYHLGIPIARQLLKDGPRIIRLSDLTDLLTPESIFNPPSVDDLTDGVQNQLWERAWDPYVVVKARCVFTNEGWGDQSSEFTQPKFEKRGILSGFVKWFKENLGF